MKRYIAAFTLVISWCALCPADSLAQTAALPVASAVEFQPQARELVDEMMKSYKELKSLSVTVKLHETNPDARRINFRAQVDFQKPDKVRIINHRWGGTLTAVVDDDHLFITQSADKNRYYRTAAPDFADVLGMVIADGPGLSDLLEGEDPLGGAFVKSACVESPSVVGGVPVDIVAIESAGTKSRTKTTLAIGHADHLLRRRLSVSTSLDGMSSAVATETDFNVKLNPVLPPSMFVFTPPPGSQKIESALDSWILGRSSGEK